MFGTQKKYKTPLIGKRLLNKQYQTGTFSIVSCSGRFMAGKVNRNRGRSSLLVLLSRLPWQDKGLMNTSILSWYNKVMPHSECFRDD
ncbi:hypothetical protein Nepgr_023490 [Nepenthes gracilis]|uniref:Uncharacterized protein n=1 Tax=Nepenthes gracilis TaxID=150966 RepID=A0AAD3T0T7_NEPGR|nr:hypothetical protein Nepgr_023490 [Nepenthes gracilis]